MVVFRKKKAQLLQEFKEQSFVYTSAIYLLTSPYTDDMCTPHSQLALSYTYRQHVRIYICTLLRLQTQPDD